MAGRVDCPLGVPLRAHIRRIGEIEQAGTHRGSNQKVYRGQSGTSTGLIQGVKAGKRGVRSVITERLFLDVKHDKKKKKKKKLSQGLSDHSSIP